jgi:hypothetical protein
MQSVLCFPGDFFGFGAQTNLAFEGVGHELPGSAKTRDLTELGDDGHRRDLCDATKGLESGDDGTHSGRCQPCRL